MKWKCLLYSGSKTVHWNCIRCVSSTSSNTSSPFSILFFGTDHFALPTLKALHKERLNSYNISSVVSKLHVVSTSNQSPVAQYAVTQGITLLPWPLKDIHDKFDVGVLVSFGRLVPSRVISMFPLGILNVHPSLLPRWRGASPVQHTVLNGDPETAVSIMSIQPRHFDTGPLVKQKQLCFPFGWSAADLSTYLAEEGAALLLETLLEMPHILTTSWPQSSVGVTYAHKPLPHMSDVNWKEHTVEEIQRQFLALSDKTPLRTCMEGETVKLMDMLLQQTSSPSLDLCSESHMTSVDLRKDNSTKVIKGSSTVSLRANCSSVHQFVDYLSPAPPGEHDTTAASIASVHVRSNMNSKSVDGEQDVSSESDTPGTVIFNRKLRAICVKCKNGWVAFRKVVYKKTMAAEDFYNGYLSRGKRKCVRFQSLHNGLFSHEYWNFVQQPKAKT
ncbi:hypothetical protein C0Q70_03488 [Pomacea canaliculata]|uniref:methionyl-tRNA formyltransferase n=1 Tax=Pomacea canaliculata TaxID=400727 RepID=A0A2T7PSW3_POMCA|nr:methionyl-tRNA formyltransferase, mitochondrial-like [Pomacea canaliculata]XP_025081992.1 methionyl-tRNA formyltransferase, mitochondrial-like [Pomacea canaliculata]PVD36504.1 hypothetical protein C0Q70_03488 [Pomacea canaliculata]